MPLANFKIVLDRLEGHINILFLYFMGEPFLNKEIYKMINYASQKGIFVSACTNGEFINPEELVVSGIDEINFQFGGMTRETHSCYRIGADWNRLMHNFKETISEKKWLRASKPKINAGLIVMRHNEHEVCQFLDWARSLGVDKAQMISPCVRNIEQGKLFLPRSDKYWFYDRVAFDEGILRPKKVVHNRCWWIYYSLVVTWEGDVLPCCRDAHGHYVMGNILEQDFDEIWNGEKYRAFRYRITTNQADFGLCKLCSGFGVPLLH
jgi:radical SAM protein with 4Fe4S-binding SPASM domain